MNRWGASADTRDDAAAAPLGQVDLARPIRVELRERRFQTSRHQQVLEVRVAAVDQEVDNFLVRLDGGGNLFFRQRAGVILVDL